MCFCEAQGRDVILNLIFLSHAYALDFTTEPTVTRPSYREIDPEGTRPRNTGREFTVISLAPAPPSPCTHRSPSLASNAPHIKTNHFNSLSQVSSSTFPQKIQNTEKKKKKEEKRKIKAMGDPRPKLPRNPIRSPDSVAPREQEFAAEDGIVFRAVDEESQSESGACSPTLWGSNSRSSPQFHRPRNRSLSPTSRIQAIARGQQELMEMVRNMPEASYELSLKDLVEYHRVANPDTSIESRDDSTSETSFRRDSSKKTAETRALVTRSRSVDSGGFYLKMFFPLPFGQISAKKKRSVRNDSGLNGSSRVSPKPPLVRDGSGKGADRDWWRKRSSLAAGESEGSVSGGSMTSSGSSNSTSSRYQHSMNRIF